MSRIVALLLSPLIAAAVLVAPSAFAADEANSAGLQTVRPAGYKPLAGDAKLGEKLFNDKKLSTNGMSCATCHANHGAYQASFAQPYLSGYSRFRGESGFAPAEQEVVFLAVSMANGCTYCAAAHSMIADKMSGVPAPVLKAIREGHAIPDAKLAALYELTQEMVRSNGQPSKAKLAAFLNAGYSEQSILYIVLAVAVKVLSNYSNHAFGTEVDDRFAAYKLG